MFCPKGNHGLFATQGFKLINLDIPIIINADVPILLVYVLQMV